MAAKGTLILRAKLEGSGTLILRAKDEGFTLVEILVTTAILTIVIALGLFVSMDVYRGYLHRSERDTIVALLERARSHAIANVREAPWGFCLDSSKDYVLFHDAYSPADVEESVPSSGASVVQNVPDCASGAIIFTQLSGTTTALASPIRVEQGGPPAATITVNDEGTIIW